MSHNPRLTNTTLFTKAYTLKQDGSLKRIVNTNTTNQKTSTAIINYKRHRNISVSALGKRSHVQYDAKMQNPLHITISIYRVQIFSINIYITQYIG